MKYLQNITNNKLKYHIIFQDDDLLIIHKNAGISTSPDLTDGISLHEQLNKDFDLPFLEPIHRLDKPTQGIIIFAKSKFCFTHLTKQFKEKSIDKTYLAIVRKVNFDERKTLSHFHLFDKQKKKAIIGNEKFKGAEQCILQLEKHSDTEIFSMLAVSPLTGKTHQIRAQLGFEQMPIVGDVKYGYRRSMNDKSIALLAYEIIFRHPHSEKKIQLKTSLPDVGIWSNFKMSKE